jgi:sec-independent protein translocase protein TatC
MSVNEESPDMAAEVNETELVRMSILDHLMELRERLVKAVLALLIGTVLSLAFTPQLLKLLIRPMGDRIPQSLAPTESIIVYFKIALIAGAVLAMPVIVYQLIRFILPGLTDQERKYLRIVVPGAGALFAIGVGFASFVMLPFTAKYLQGFLSDIILPNWTINNYIGFVTTLAFWLGVVFETPLIIAFLARLGIISPQMLAKNRKYAIVLIAVMAAVITPTPDPVNMTLVMVPLYLLFEVGVILARLLYRPRA